MYHYTGHLSFICIILDENRLRVFNIIWGTSWGLVFRINACLKTIFQSHENINPQIYVLVFREQNNCNRNTRRWCLLDTVLMQERREICIKQLIPTSEPLSRIKVKVFGSSGVGKTTLIDSLKCGYLSSFFRKARISNSSSSTNVHRKGKKGFHNVQHTV